MKAFFNQPEKFEDVATAILSHLEVQDLSKMREVSRKWNMLACKENLWKALCVKQWKSL